MAKTLFTLSYKIIHIIIVLFVTNFSLLGQEDDFLIDEEPLINYKLINHLVLDANVMIQFGDDGIVGFNSQIGYELSPKIQLGGGLSYSVLYTPNEQRVRYADTQLGLTLYSSIDLYKGLFIRTDFQHLIPLKSATSSDSEKLAENTLYLGGGYRGMVSEKIAFSTGFYMEPGRPFNQPLLRTGLEYYFGRN